MTLTSDLIAQTRGLIFCDVKPERNRLNSAIDDNDTSFTFMYSLKSAGEGATLGVNLEEMHVWQDEGQSVTVQRADAGSTAASHAQGDTVWVTPYTPWRILGAINDELRGLTAHQLFRVRTMNLSWTQNGEYDLDAATDFLGLVNVQEDPSTTDYARTLREVRLNRSVNGDTVSLNVLDAVSPASTVTVTYKSKFGVLSSLSQNVTTQTGLWDEAHDILPLGAAIRLLTGAEMARSHLHQGDTRRAGEIPPGARNQGIRMHLARYEQRLADEATRLRIQYPEYVR